MAQSDHNGPSAIESTPKRSAKAHGPEVNNRFLYGDDMAKVEKSPLDSERVKNLHTRMVSHYLREMDRQAAWRTRMARDEAFYDSDQWTAEDIQILEARGQDPLVMNVIAQSLNWIIGSQRRARTDYKILPRRKEAAKAAERKSQLLKYLADVNKSRFSESDAFEEMTKAGLSFIECGVQEDTDGEPIYDRYESWRNIVWDSTATERDMSDGRYMFRTKWADLDDACAMFPKRKHHIEASASSTYEFGGSVDRYGDDAMDKAEQDSISDSYSSIEHPDSHRERVRLIEAWFKVPEQEQVMGGGDFAGEMYDPDSPGHVEQVETGQAEVRTRLTYRIYVMVMTTKHVLWFSKSPYRHNRYPFTPMWCYRKAGTREPYGVVRNMVDAQRDINKRFSKALAILSSNKTIMDEGAVPDLDEYAEEIGNPNAVIVKKKGFELKIDADRELSAAHLNVMQMSIQMIQTLSGVTDEAMGKTTNAVSGKAIMARQEQGSVSTAKPFDSLRACKQYHGEKKLSLVEQFMGEPKQFRITNSRGQPDYVEINDGMPENDIVRTKADYVVSEDDFNASMRQAQVAELMELMVGLAPVAPQVVMVLLDLVVEAMDVHSREEIVKRIRAITGMEDPDVDPSIPDPEREAREQQKAKQSELEQRAAIANLEKLEGEAAKARAVADKESANAAKVLQSMPGETVEQKRKALELALALIAAPPLAVDTADVLVENAEAPMQPPPPQEPPMPEQGMAQPIEGEM
ncbi:hypothetical protein [Roseicitreum antarcticum]|uniref:Portal protein n=1 Tax=Roseicitreum antarcticum TaxID=564137 RepID=A0A1H3E4W0_9RHOB|nr:hypothetical protein [Roseicitreum antarcticum]SDX73715.1 hypothetical protein SAMN04488238_11810 [Roseicitreum antarcticum]